MLAELDTYDWQEVFKYAKGLSTIAGDAECSTVPFDREDVESLYALEEGQNDEADWLALGKLKDGRFFFARAGCDYTGWG